MTTNSQSHLARPHPLEASLIPDRVQRIHRCERGQLAVEYLLINIGVVLPVFFAMATAYFNLYIYFYRTTSILSLPFP